jgi:hypothetical protein
MAEKSKKKGAASFCIPRAAIEALINAQASAVEVCAYLVLARFTDPSGVYTSSSGSAVRRYVATHTQTIAKAIARLTTINATVTRLVPAKSKGKTETETVTLGPILQTREQWLAAHPDQVLPDGPTERGKVRHVLPDFGEPENERVWFGANLVSGFGTFTQPLRSVKDAGPVAARLLLELYRLHDLDQWGGVDPIQGPRNRYEIADETTKFGARIIRAERVGKAAISERITTDQDAYWNALEALESAGLIYEMVTVLNRSPIEKQFASGALYGAVPDDAEPLYELDCRSSHGYKPEGEEGLAGLTARTAADFSRPVTEAGYADHQSKIWYMPGQGPGPGGTDPAYISDRIGGEVGGHKKARFNGTYAAVVSAGQGAMVIGIYRLRFRAANPKNAGIKGAWAKIYEGNRRALELINAVRNRAGLPALPAPGDVAAKARAAAAEMAPHAVPKHASWNDPTIPF